jgi:hypothetical protein
VGIAKAAGALHVRRWHFLAILPKGRRPVLLTSLCRSVGDHPVEALDRLVDDVGFVVVLSAAARPRLSKLLVAGADRPLLELAHPRYAHAWRWPRRAGGFHRPRDASGRPCRRGRRGSDSAAFPEMSLTALSRAQPDHVGPPADRPSLLESLLHQAAGEPQR